MARESDPLNRETEDRYERERIRYDWMLQSILKFRLFFVGLVFAVLAFSIQFSVEAATSVVWFLQAFAWAALLITGLLSLRDAGGLVASYTENVFEGLPKLWRVVMWVLFVLGIALLAVARLASTHAP